MAMMMPAMMISETPLPTPCSVICSPNHINNIVPAVMKITEVTGITEQEFEQLAEKQDACYHKVKSRYKVWPSAYASGALVQCRKKGAPNWGNSKKK